VRQSSLLLKVFAPCFNKLLHPLGSSVGMVPGFTVASLNAIANLRKLAPGLSAAIATHFEMID
jgi:hypothetical protein